MAIKGIIKNGVALESEQIIGRISQIKNILDETIPIKNVRYVIIGMKGYRKSRKKGSVTTVDCPRYFPDVACTTNFMTSRITSTHAYTDRQ